MSVDKSEQRIRRMFGEIAQRYDLLNHLLSGGVDYYWRWRTVRLVRPDGDDPILDICTGTGDLALAYWQRTGYRTPVVGADFTHEMLTLANDKLARRRSRLNGQASPLAFVEADAQRLPFADNQFQLVSVAFGLRNITSTEAGLREMTRVCRPGGHVAVLEFSMPGNPVFRSVYRWYFRNILPRIGQLLARNRQAAYDYLPRSVAEFPQGRELADMLAASGLTDVRFRPFTFGIATLYWGRKP